MSNTLFAAITILSPVHGFLRRLAGAGAPVRRLDPPFAAPSTRAAVSKPLRVVRVMEDGHGPAHGGRMMISGRMADVCAELDRMAARETALRTGS
ncbi:MAG: hypothetical protein EBY24_04660 [Betaproteobacteria bacterium]|jgi:hypothetical protein|nr:hypothetical protein [Betaproteobacteria bacterium]